MTATNDFSQFKKGLSTSAENAFSITPHDTNELSHVTRGLSVGAAGDVALVAAGDSVAVTVYLAAGIIHPIRAKIIKNTSTTATGIVGWY